jgi:hypothetical protein
MTASVEPGDKMRLLSLQAGVGDSDLAETQLKTPAADVAC